jgi:hypothetical protein
MIFVKQLIILLPLFIAMRLIAEKISETDKEIRERIIYYFGVISIAIGVLLEKTIFLKK